MSLGLSAVISFVVGYFTSDIIRYLSKLDDDNDGWEDIKDV